MRAIQEAEKMPLPSYSEVAAQKRKIQLEIQRLQMMESGKQRRQATVRMLKAKLSNRLAQIQERRDVTRMMQIRQKLGATKFVQEGRVATPLGSLKLR